MSNCIVLEFLGTEASIPPATLKLASIQGTDVLSSGTNASHDLILQLQKWDATQWPNFGQGNLPELNYSGFVHVMDTNSFKMFQSLCAAIPCHEIITSECITNGFATGYMTNDSVWKEFVAPFKTKGVGICVLTNIEFFVWSRMLDNGEVVIAVPNKGTAAGTVNVPFNVLSGLNSTDPYTVFDDWAQTNYGTFSGSFTTPPIVNGSAGLFHIRRGTGLNTNYTITALNHLLITNGWIYGVQ